MHGAFGWPARALLPAYMLQSSALQRGKAVLALPPPFFFLNSTSVDYGVVYSNDNS